MNAAAHRTETIQIKVTKKERRQIEQELKNKWEGNPTISSYARYLLQLGRGKAKKSWVILSDLKPHPGNPRKIDDERLQMLKASIAKFGDLGCFVYNRRTNRLVSGHRRQDVMPPDAEVIKITKHDPPTSTGTVADGFIQIGDERFKYREVDWSETDEIAANIAANKHGGEWDYPKLAEFVLELDHQNYDLDLTGFTATEIEDIMTYIPDGGHGDPDDVPDVPKEALTKRGELWTLGEHRLLIDDCTDPHRVELLFLINKAELCFTSPPYSDQRDYTGASDLSPFHLAKCLSAPAELFAVNLGYQRKEGEVFCYWNDWIHSAQTQGLKLLSWNIWDRGGAASLGQHTAMFPVEHEWIFVFGRSGKELNRTIENKYAGQVIAGSTNREVDGSMSVSQTRIAHSHRPIGTILRCDIHRGESPHPAMFPVEFPVKYIEACTNKGNLVYDPFLGSGSTLIACEKTGRRCFGMEIEPLYADVILSRYSKFTGKDPVREDGVKWSELTASSVSQIL